MWRKERYILMREISIENDSLKMRVFVNGIPDANMIPENERSILVSQLEIHISQMFEKNEKRKKYRK